MRISASLATLLAVCTLVACGDTTPSAPRTKSIGCASDLDCGIDEICADRLCVRAPHGGIGPAPFDGGTVLEDGGVSAPDGGLSDGGAPPDAGPPDAGTPDAGPPDAGADGGRPDGGAPRYCQPCTSDGQCGASMKCVTTERTGERFCSPACDDSSTCPGGSSCANFLVSSSKHCLPNSNTCVAQACTAGGGCPPETPLCDTGSGRCYRSESKHACQSCAFSYQCGGFWDRCITLADSSRVCGKDCDTARGGTCSSGYRCAEMTAPTGETIRQCVPLAGGCSGCRQDNPCSNDRYCDVATGLCVDRGDVAPSCSTCDRNSDCGPVTATCYQGGCMPYCDNYTPCSAGYRCATITDPERGQQRRCIPNSSTGQSCETLLHCSRCNGDDDCNGGKCYQISSNNRRCVQYCDVLGTECPQGSSCTSVGLSLLCVPQSCPN